MYISLKFILNLSKFNFALLHCTIYIFYKLKKFSFNFFTILTKIFVSSIFTENTYTYTLNCRLFACSIIIYNISSPPTLYLFSEKILFNDSYTFSKCTF
jgi:hypothetical protein